MFGKQRTGNWRTLLLAFLWAAFLLLAMTLSTMAWEGSMLFFPIVRREFPPPPPTPVPGKALISEVLYAPLVGEPDSEWIEIYNAGGTALDLGEYKIGDEETRGKGEGMFAFPPGARLLPGQTAVIAGRASVFSREWPFLPDFELLESDPRVPNMMKYVLWASGNVELVNSGDQLLLLNGEDTLVDGVSWGDAYTPLSPPVPKVLAGHSLERKPASLDTDSAGDWVDQGDPDPGGVAVPLPTQIPTLTPVYTGTLQVTPTFDPSASATLISQTSTPAQPPTPDAYRLLRISEVFYDPKGEDPGGEWLEVYNTGPGEIDLSGFKIGDEETRGEGEGMLQFPAGARILPGDVLLIANRGDLFSTVWGFSPDYEVTASDPNIPDLKRYGEWASGSLNLNNAGDELLLLSRDDRFVDLLAYGASAFSAFQPTVPDVVEGHSLERRPANKDTDSREDWVDQPVPDPGKVALSPVSSPTPTPANDPTPTRISTATRTLTPTRTATLPARQSPTLTLTRTATPTYTATPKLSLTLTPTRTSTPTSTLTATRTSTPTPPLQPGHVLISEVYYWPWVAGPNEEWIELYNPTGALIDLREYKIGDEESPGGGEGMMRFPAGASIGGYSYLVIAYKATNFSTLYGFKPQYEMEESDPEVPNLAPYYAWCSGTVELHNSTDEVLLMDGSDHLVDAVAYGASSFPPFQPPVDSVDQGHSIQRSPPGQDTDRREDWIDQPAPDPG